MPPQDLQPCRLVAVFQAHCKELERMGWKNMDPSEISLQHLQFFKAVAKVVYTPTKTGLRRGVLQSKLALSIEEAALLREKVKNTLTWCKQKLRYAGSGKFLPSQVVAIAKVWKTSRGWEKEDIGEEEGRRSRVLSQTIRNLFGLPEKTEPAEQVTTISASEGEVTESVLDYLKASSHFCHTWLCMNEA